MSKGGSDTTTTTQALDPFTKQQLQNASNYAQGVAALPYQPYYGQRVADFSGDQQASFDLARNYGNAGQNQLGQAQNFLQGGLAGTSGTLASTNLQPYMNPYSQSVTQNALGDLERQRVMAQQGNSADAIRAKAFGGTREAVQRSLTDEAYGRQAGNLSAQLNQQNFQQAQQAAQGDLGRQQQYATGLANLGLGDQQRMAQQFAMLQATGGQQQNLAQQNLGANYDAFKELQGYPQQQLQTYLSGVPGMGGSTTSQQTPTSSNPLGGALGGAALGAAIPALGPYGWAIGAGLGLLGS